MAPTSFDCQVDVRSLKLSPMGLDNSKLSPLGDVRSTSATLWCPGGLIVHQEEEAPKCMEYSVLMSADANVVKDGQASQFGTAVLLRPTPKVHLHCWRACFHKWLHVGPEVKSDIFVVQHEERQCGIGSLQDGSRHSTVYSSRSGSFPHGGLAVSHAARKFRILLLAAPRSSHAPTILFTSER